MAERQLRRENTMANGRKRGVVRLLRVSLAATVAVALCLPVHSATWTDGFEDGAIETSLWKVPPDIDGTCNLTEINGRLEFTGSLVPDASVRAGLDSLAYGAQDLDWTILVDMAVDGGQSQFSGIGATDVVVATLAISPSGAVSELNGRDNVEMNLALLDTSVFGLGGWDHGLRFNGKTNDSDDQTIEFLGQPGPVQVRMKVDYTAASQTIAGSYDLGSGFVALGNPVDTSAWGMVSGDVFDISLKGSSGGIFDDPTAGTYSIGSGQVYFDDFVGPAGGGMSPGTVVLDDHFDGDSGGAPAGWSVVMGTEGPDGVAEAGSNVVINGSQDNPTVIGCDTTFDPQGIETTIRVGIDEITPNGRGWAGLFSSGLSSIFVVQLRGSDGRFEVTAGAPEEGDSHALAYLSSYDGGEAILTITLDADSFRIRCDVEDYDSGDLLFADYFPNTHFTPADLGDSVTPSLFAAGQPDGAASFDWMTVTTIPEPATLSLLGLGSVLALVGKRRGAPSVRR